MLWMKHYACLQTIFGSTPRDSPTVIFSQSYTDAEIEEAKKILADQTKQLCPKPDELKKVHKRQTYLGSGECTTLYTLLDSKKFTFPRFFAANFQRRSRRWSCAKLQRVSPNCLQATDINSVLVKVTDSCAAITSQVSVNSTLGTNALSAGLLRASFSYAATTLMTSHAVPEVPVSKDGDDDSAGGSSYESTHLLGKSPTGNSPTGNLTYSETHLLIKNHSYLWVRTTFWFEVFTNHWVHVWLAVYSYCRPTA